ncbi:MAG: hypothetical protein JW884_14570 [Deltaproteobacteria bacterium]|nr:hypothetical protein [Deltaproteobacteria bacterium]
MSVLITMVGLRPGAVAVTAKTLHKNAGLSHVVLLHTRGENIEDNRDRLIEYLRSLGITATSWPIPAEPIAGKSGLIPAWQCIQQILDQPDPPGPVYFDVSPGLNYQIALISFFLKSEKQFVPIYADYDHLYAMRGAFTDGQNKYDLKDVGRAELLALYGLTWNETIKQIQGGDAPFGLEAIMERHGRIHGLVRFFLKEMGGARVLLRRAREVQSFIENPARLNRLQLDLMVETDHESTKNRFLSYGAKAFIHNPQDRRASEKKIEALMQKPPGGRIEGDREDTLNLTPRGFVECDEHPDGWDGPNLLVALGSDPSATLLALFTHKPATAIILVTQTPEVQKLAQRIYDQRAKIPVRKLIFWGANLNGKIGHYKELQERMQGGGWIVNISPGTKAQTWNMAAIEGVEVWSLNNREQVAVRLVPAAAQQELQKFAFAPILLQAAVCGGPVEGRTENELYGIGGNGDKRDFLERLSAVMAKAARKNLNGRLSGLLKGGDSREFDGNLIRFDRCEDNPTRPGSVNIMVTVSHNGHELNGTIAGTWGNQNQDGERRLSGTWLEEPIAAAFIAARGRNQQVLDLCMGPRWAWQRTQNGEFKTEIDIVLLWQGHYICISCKRGGDHYTPEELEAIRSEIVTEAKANLGRFAVPVLVRGGIPVTDLMNEANESVEEGRPLEIGLGLLDQRETLRKLVEAAIASNKTVAENTAALE